MSFVYSGGGIANDPPNLIGNAINFPLTVGSGEVASFQVTNDGGLTWTTISYTTPSPSNWSDINELVNFLNLSVTGTPPFDIFWFKYSDQPRLVIKTVSINGPKAGIRVTTTGSPAFSAALGFPNTVFPGPFLAAPAFGKVGFSYFVIEPSDGDPVTALSVDLYKEALQDRDISMLNSFSQVMNVTPSISYKILSGSNDIFISPITGAVVTYSGKPLLISTRDEIVFTPPTLLADTFYFLYTFWDGSLVQFEASTTYADPANPNYKNGDHSRKFLGTFRTDGSGNIIPCYKHKNLLSYYEPINIMTDANSGGGFVNKSLINAVPYTTGSASTFHSLVKYRMRVKNPDTAAWIVDFGRGDITSYITLTAGPLTVQEYLFDYGAGFDLMSDGFKYRTADPSTLVTVDIFGYYE